MKNIFYICCIIQFLRVNSGEKLVHKGQQVEIVCQSPEKNADLLKWTKIPKNSDFQLTQRSISILSVNITNSGLYQCRSKVKGSTPHGTVLTVWTQPLIKISITRVFRVKQSCQMRRFQRFITTAKAIMCKGQTKCKIKIDSFCFTSNEKGQLGMQYPYHFGIYAYMLVAKLPVGETVDCDPGCLRQRRMHEAVVLFDNGLDRLEREEKRWIKKYFKKPERGVQLDERLSKELNTELLCEYPGYHLHGQSMCLPCVPGTYKPKEEKFHQSNTECIPCAPGCYQLEYAAEACIECPPQGDDTRPSQCDRKQAGSLVGAKSGDSKTDEDEEDDDQPCSSSFSSTLGSSWLVLVGKLEQMGVKEITAVLCVILLGLMIIPLLCVCCMASCANKLYHVRKSLEDVGKEKVEVDDSPQRTFDRSLQETIYEALSDRGQQDHTYEQINDINLQEPIYQQIDEPIYQQIDEPIYQENDENPYLEVLADSELTPLNSTMRDEQSPSPMQFNSKRLSIYNGQSANNGQAPLQQEYLDGYEVPVPYQPQDGLELDDEHNQHISNFSNYAQNNNSSIKFEEIFTKSPEDNFTRHNSQVHAMMKADSIKKLIHNSLDDSLKQNTARNEDRMKKDAKIVHDSIHRIVGNDVSHGGQQLISRADTKEKMVESGSVGNYIGSFESMRNAGGGCTRAVPQCAVQPAPDNFAQNNNITKRLEQPNHVNIKGQNNIAQPIVVQRAILRPVRVSDLVRDRQLLLAKTGRPALCMQKSVLIQSDKNINQATDKQIIFTADDMKNQSGENIGQIDSRPLQMQSGQRANNISDHGNSMPRLQDVGKPMVAQNSFGENMKSINTGAIRKPHQPANIDYLVEKKRRSHPPPPYSRT